MRWSIIRLIWWRELRDQFRDRRTLFTILALPLVLYPLLSLLVLQFALTLLLNPGTVGIVPGDDGGKTFPPVLPGTGAQTAYPAGAWLTVAPLPGVTAFPGTLGAIALADADRNAFDLLPLLENGEIPATFRHERQDRPELFAGALPLRFRFLTRSPKEALESREVDLVLAAPPDFLFRVGSGLPATVKVRGRPDDASRRAREQLDILLGRWRDHLMEVRLRRSDLPGHFDEPFAVETLPREKPAEEVAAETLLDLLVRTFPFMLVMWSLAGALHPAIDLCAGEKERGTMETLLISPAAREEIVLGKFLTIWVFSAGTSVMHLVSMGIATRQLREMLPEGAFTLPALLWCVVLLLPLSALFAAVSLAVGAYARSSKEGQYYLMPLFWLVMPLVFLTMAPGVELNQFYSMVPVTGVALLMQRLMLAPSLDRVPWFYFLPVFATVILYSWIALRWAVGQFQREDVLFREAERLDLGLWVRHLFREKEALPTVGQALFCFAVLLALRWVSLDIGGEPLLARTTIVLLAFVAAPPLLMAVLLTRRPRLSLGLSFPPAGYWLTALLLLPLAELAHFGLLQFPAVFALLDDRRAYVEQAYHEMGPGSVGAYWVLYYLVLGLLPALSRELAFRGFILNGLRSRLATGTAVLLGSFLFAVYHLNVFALLPAFLVGLAAGVLAVRSGSVLPGVLLHAGSNVLLLRGPLVNLLAADTGAPSATAVLPVLVPVALACTALAVWLLWRLPGPASGAKRHLPA